MPRKLSRWQRLLMTVGGTVGVAAALPGAALAAECPVQETAKPFAAFGDLNDYYLAPGGSFELMAWSDFGPVSLSGENDPLGLEPGTSSVRLVDGGTVVSEPICVDNTMPHLRFVAKGRGQLDVEVRVVRNGSTDSSSGSISESDHRVWAPSRYVELKTGTIPAGESATATIRFRSQGEWLVDNVFLDPYRR